MWIQPAGMSSRLNVLVADDDAFMRKLVAGLLGRSGMACAVVADGLGVLSHPALHDADLILLDVSMPGLDGLATLARLRSMEHGVAPKRRQRVVMVTAYAEPGDTARLHAAGADGCIAKPIDPLQFHREIRRVLALPAHSPSRE
jgi:CheY-like chemotaxis protein